MQQNRFIVTSVVDGSHYMATGATCTDAAVNFFTMHMRHYHDAQFSCLVFTPVDVLHSPYAIAESSSLVRTAPILIGLYKRAPRSFARYILCLNDYEDDAPKYAINFAEGCWSPDVVVGSYKQSYRRRSIVGNLFKLNACSMAHNFVATSLDAHSTDQSRALPFSLF